MGKQQPVLYPKYIEKEFKNRTLAFLDDMNVVTTEQGDIHIIGDYSTLLCLTFNQNLLTFSLNIPRFPWLAQVIAGGNKPFCNEDGIPLGIRLAGSRNTSRWIANAIPWGAEEYIDTYGVRAWLALMRQAYDMGGVGTPPSVGGWGQAMFRASFQEQYGQEWRYKRHRRPSGSYAEKIRYESSGARSEVLQLNVTYPVAYENDQHNAYGASLAHAQPTGKCYRVRGKGALDYLFYFVECEVTIHEPLMLGCFPMRTGQGRERHPVFPIQPGTYRAWLWNREIAVCQQEGLTVQILAGFAWQEATYDFAPFVEKIAALRNAAPPAIKPLLKLALVAAVGRLGMPEERYVIVPGEQRKEGDRAIGQAGIAYDWWIHQETESYPQSMPHIFSHTLMLCRLSLYQMAKRCMEAELNVIATNTDAVITEKRLSEIPMKGEPVNTGDWTAFELHDVVVKANRHLDSREKSVHPGIPRNIPKR